MATIKPAAQLKPTDVHSVHGSISRIRRQNGRIYVHFVNGVNKIYKAVEHISVQ